MSERTGSSPGIDDGAMEESTIPAVYVHPSAIVETSEIGPGTQVWAFAHVLAGARVGGECNLGDHCYIEGGVVIGYLQAFVAADPATLPPRAASAPPPSPATD